MKNLRDHLLKKYDLDISLTKCYSFINSYAKDVSSSIVFAHYDHEQTFSLHKHPSQNKEHASLFIFLSGNLSFMAGDNLYTPSYGDAICFREHEDFVSFFSSISSVDYYEISFGKEFFEKSACSKMFAAPFYNRELYEQNMITLDSANRNFVIEKLRDIEHITHAQFEHADELSYAYLVEIMDVLSYSFSVGHNMPISISKIPQKLNMAITYIHDNFRTIESISEISEECGISNTYMEKMFRNNLYCSPVEYLTNHRLSYAKYLLANGASVTDACFKSGFNNYSYFISKFKKSTGVTPLKFKKSSTQLHL